MAVNLFDHTLVIYCYCLKPFLFVPADLLVNHESPAACCMINCVHMQYLCSHTKPKSYMQLSDFSRDCEPCIRPITLVYQSCLQESQSTVTIYRAMIMLVFLCLHSHNQIFKSGRVLGCNSLLQPDMARCIRIQVLH